MYTKTELINKIWGLENKYSLQAIEELRVRGWLTDGSLRGVAMCQAQLQDANLMEADLSNADFHQANLDYADLRKARLNGAKFNRASLSAAWRCLCSASAMSCWTRSRTFCNGVVKRVATSYLKRISFQKIAGSLK